MKFLAAGRIRIRILPPPGTFESIEDMVGGGATNFQSGQWTDDTSMALLLAESLIEGKGFDPVDQLRRYVRSLLPGQRLLGTASLGR
jgi:ADP-ribosylglycohydrolase